MERALYEHGELQQQIKDGVMFYCLEDDLKILGVMGIQDRKDVNLIRHAYVRTDARRKVVGGQLLRYLQKDQEKPILIGTWADAVWAIEFYRREARFPCGGARRAKTAVKEILDHSGKTGGDFCRSGKWKVWCEVDYAMVRKRYSLYDILKKMV